MLYKFEFSEQELNLLLKGLGELPAKESIKMIERLHAEYSEQSAVKEEPKEDATKKVK